MCLGICVAQFLGPCLPTAKAHWTKFRHGRFFSDHFCLLLSLLPPALMDSRHINGHIYSRYMVLPTACSARGCTIALKHLARGSVSVRLLWRQQLDLRLKVRSFSTGSVASSCWRRNLPCWFCTVGLGRAICFTAHCQSLAFFNDL